MTEKRITPEMIALIPDLEAWGDAEIGIEDWVGHAGNYQLAVGYSRIFWPRIVKFGDYVLLERYADAESVAVWEKTIDGNKAAVEAMLNHIHMVDLQGANPAAVHNETQLIELGRTLKEICEAKLAHLFPELRFVVEFDDTPGLDPTEYQVTFWRVRA